MRSGRQRIPAGALNAAPRVLAALLAAPRVLAALLAAPRVLAALLAAPTLAAILVGSAALATTYRQLTPGEMVEAAEIGFLGTVAATSVEAREGEPWTVVEFEVERWLTGPAPEGDRARLAFLGGSYPAGTDLQVNLMPRFEVGERVLILAYDEEYYSPIVGFNQGLWRVRGDALIDSQGRRLSLDREGRLQADGDGPEAALVVDALARELEARQ
jgi:hypothetical protein